MVRIFAYGSLIFSPELPDRVVHRERAVLRGHVRAFNKRSGPRACAAGDRGFTELEVAVPERFRPPHSLALGTRPGEAMHGVVLGYDAGEADALFAVLDEREGVDRAAPESSWSYRPTEVELDTPSGVVRAWTYLSNPGGDWHEEGLDLAMTARVLLHATPAVRQHRALGVDYLLDTARALAGNGVRDPHLDALIAELPPDVRVR